MFQIIVGLAMLLIAAVALGVVGEVAWSIPVRRNLLRGTAAVLSWIHVPSAVDQGCLDQCRRRVEGVGGLRRAVGVGAAVGVPAVEVVLTDEGGRAGGHGRKRRNQPAAKSLISIFLILGTSLLIRALIGFLNSS